MTDMNWRIVERPGFFGRRKDEKIAELNKRYGEGNWLLRHILPRNEMERLALTEMKTQPSIRLEDTYDYLRACKELYEESYYRHLRDNPAVVSQICHFSEVYDNAETNVQSGMDYTVQESYSNHIQDIAIRNCLSRLGRRFSVDPGAVLLQVRGPGSIGYRLGLGPGQVPFFDTTLIVQPSLAPGWAGKGSVEDLWQSNKHVLVRL